MKNFLVMYISDKFSVNERLKFTLTQIKIWKFFAKIAKSNTGANEAILVREIWYKQNSSFLMKTSDLTKILGTKLKYLLYLNKMIEKYEMRKFILLKIHAFTQNDFKGLA